MFQPCHRCDRARLAISVPSPRRSSFLSVGISPSPLVRSATVSLVLEFDWPPLISSSTASLDQWCIHLDSLTVAAFQQIHDATVDLHPY
ncbi:uncharacterized protein PGTG_21174 [Puccinia graminis f. sp. tritici CRL 75-36-700-3]|uniref:Uncharacterized protein n=1 Tax=Puccinia graminis f. sp. tritici (strain CRL 75-36-700-3 / race SCCL) TaxID=418459 RepID=H6QQL4_PUCGT|nr:uncharacterized protein PGTG_21174 [Puccinia graminis f. sp. tritici CRL 75-36-700-3]EHS62666.1 hypothetical protein PGTG_21174 [Puccinia graminis f. sp. tritici CRL 75-36-700-3]